MESNVKKIKTIITLNDYAKGTNIYKHLFEVQLPTEDLKLWKPRYNFELGTLLVGDLLLDLEQERALEIHPFPEWVVYLKSLRNTKAKPYLIVPNFSKSFVGKLSRKSVENNISLIQEEVNKLTIEDLISFEYEIGVNVLVPAFIPHFFISSKIDKVEGETPPYLQVFEPNLEPLTRNLNIKTTYFFKLPFKVFI